MKMLMQKEKNLIEKIVKREVGKIQIQLPQIISTEVDGLLGDEEFLEAVLLGYEIVGRILSSEK